MLHTCFLYLFPWSSHHSVNYFFSNLTKTSFFSSCPSLAACPLSTQTADPRKSTPSMLWWCGSRISINKSTILLGTIFSLLFLSILLSSPISACPGYQVLLSPTGLLCLLPIICWTPLFLLSTPQYLPSYHAQASLDKHHFLHLQCISTS